MYLHIYIYLHIYCDLPVDPVAGVGEAKGELLLPGGQQQGRGDQHHRDLQQRHLRRQSLSALWLCEGTERGHVRGHVGTRGKNQADLAAGTCPGDWAAPGWVSRDDVMLCHAVTSVTTPDIASQRHTATQHRETFHFLS